MTGSIQVKKGRQNYFAVLNAYDDNGKRKLKWIDTGIPVKGNNKRKADAKLKELLVLYDENNVDLSKDILVVDFFKTWLEALKHSIAPTTYDAYKITLKAHLIPYFEPKKLKVRDITPAHIQQYVSHKMKKLSANTVREHLANISKCLDSAVRQNLIAFNPVARIDKPKKVKFTGAKHYNEKQIEQLFECSKDDPLEIVNFLTVFYGLRRSEVLGLKWSAIDLENNTLTIQHTVVKVDKITHMEDSTKNDSSYSVMPLPEIVKSRLLKWKDEQDRRKLLQPNDYVENGYVCTQMNGSLIKPNYVTQHFKLLLEKNGMPLIRFHDLRHSSAGYLKHLKFDLKDIQTWLRHSDIQTTMNIYMNLDMEAKTNIANKIDAKFKEFKTV